MGVSVLAFFMSRLFFFFNAVVASRAGGPLQWMALWDMVLLCETFATTPTLIPRKPTAQNCACDVTAFLGRKKCIQVLRAEFQTLTRQGLDHIPCTTFCPAPLCVFAVHPTLLIYGPTDQFWSCDGCVSRVHVFECQECLCPKVRMQRNCGVIRHQPGIAVRLQASLCLKAGALLLAPMGTGLFTFFFFCFENIDFCTFFPVLCL